MKTTTIYIAEDGTKFLKKESCIRYENLFRNNPNPGLILLDRDGSIIPLSKYNSAFWINIIDPDIVDLRLESVRVEEEFPHVAYMPTQKGYYSTDGQRWNKEEKAVYDFCSRMDTYNDISWWTLMQALLQIHENDNNMFVKVTDVEGNLIYDRMPVREAMQICIGDAKNMHRRMVWYKEIKDTTYVIIH